MSTSPSSSRSTAPSALFGAEHANVQPHSGSQANMAVYFSQLQPGDTILAMDLTHGGHLTHGSPVNFSGKFFKVVPYGVRREDERLDIDAMRELAREHRPKMIVVGYSAYPRAIDFAPFRAAADEVGAHGDGRHRALRRPGRGRHPPVAGAAGGVRHDDDAQDPARPARRHGALQGALREEPQLLGLPRQPGRAADARHRRQGGGAARGGDAGVPHLPAADRPQRQGAGRRADRSAASASCRAGPTIT